MGYEVILSALQQACELSGCDVQALSWAGGAQADDSSDSVSGLCAGPGEKICVPRNDYESAIPYLENCGQALMPLVLDASLSVQRHPQNFWPLGCIFGSARNK